jgi:hypothetical protein
MPQARVLRVGRLTSGALAYRFLPSGLGSVGTACCCGFRKMGSGSGGGGWSHCWVLRERTPPGLPGFVGGRVCSCLQAPWGLTFAGLAGGVLACGPVRPPYRIVFPVVRSWGWFLGVGVGGGVLVVVVGVVSVRVLRTA